MDYLFEKSEPIVRQMYDDLIAKVKMFGKVTVEPKKTSLHVLNKSAFLGIHPKKKYLDLTIVTNQPLQSGRVSKVEQVSKSRYHNDLRLTQMEDIESELLDWLKTAYILKG